MPERLYSTYQVADLLGATNSEVEEWMLRGWLRGSTGVSPVIGGAEGTGGTPVLPSADEPARISETDLIEFLKARGIDIETIMAKAVLNEGRSVRSAGSTGVSPVIGGAEGTGGTPVLPTTRPALAAPPADSAAQLVEGILRDAVERSASVIHLEPGPDGLALRLRVSGQVQEKVNFQLRLPRTLAPRVIDRFKALCQSRTGVSPVTLDDTGRRPVLRGRFALTIQGRQFDFELSVCPTAYGERLAIAVLDREAWPAPAWEDLPGADFWPLGRLLSAPYGLIVTAGMAAPAAWRLTRALVRPTDRHELNIAVVTERDECGAEGFCLIRPDADGGLTRPEALEALARQDMDLVLLDGLADGPTAARTVQLVRGGARVLATMRLRHPWTVPSALLELGVASGELASTLAGVVSQGRLRRLCPDCKLRAPPAPQLLAELRLAPSDLPAEVFQAKGCTRCWDTGYAGRTAVTTALEIDEGLTRLLRRGCSPAELERVAGEAWQRVLRSQLLARVSAGQTTLAEMANLLPAGATRHVQPPRLLP